jgi:micrococcal nuclease
MTGWTVKDEATHIFTFPSFHLAPQATVTLYSGSGTNTTDKLYWNRADERYAIWNNTGDTVYLRDVNGNLVIEYSY